MNENETIENPMPAEWDFDNNKKPQKFFERFLDTDLEDAAASIKLEEQRIINEEMIV